MGEDSSLNLILFILYRYTTLLTSDCYTGHKQYYDYSTMLIPDTDLCIVLQNYPRKDSYPYLSEPFHPSTSGL